MRHYGYFELKRDEDTGRLYWWGSEDGWKDATEIGEDGILTLHPEAFRVGTTLSFMEPMDEAEFHSIYDDAYYEAMAIQESLD